MLPINQEQSLQIQGEKREHVTDEGMLKSKHFTNLMVGVGFNGTEQFVVIYWNTNNYQ